MALIERSKNTLMIVVGQSNETREQPSVARPVLDQTALTSPARTQYTVGADHGINLNSSVRFGKPGESTTGDLTITDFDTDSITLLDADVDPATYDNTGSYVYDNAKVQTSSIGCPNSGTGMWSYFSEQMWLNKNEWLQTVDNFARGGTSFITDWCGTTGSGDSRTVLGSGDGGFDPNNYLADVVADLGTWANSFDECIVAIQHGQDDASKSVSYTSTGATTDAIQLGYYTTALNNIVDYINANLSPTKIYMGSSQSGGVGATNQDAAGFAAVIVPAMRSSITSKGLIEGPMLSELLGSGSLHNYTDAHLNVDGQRQAGREWAGRFALSSGDSSITTPTLGVDGWETSQIPDNTGRNSTLGANGWEVPAL